MPKTNPNNILPFPKGQEQGDNAPLFAALDLGTNSCRMLIARPNEHDFSVMDAFSKAVYLGHGLDKSGVLTHAAIRRTISALNVCASKLRKHNVQHCKLVATAACRQAKNGRDFIKQIKAQTGLDVEIIKPHEEARYAVIGSASHVLPSAEQVMVIDIGGGSTELVWIDVSAIEPTQRRNALMHLKGSLKKPTPAREFPDMKIVDWISVPFGVTTLRDQFLDVDGDGARYAMMSWHFEEYVSQFGPFGDEYASKSLDNFQIIGTSGTVTTIAASFMNLQRYERTLVDGFQMSSTQVEEEIDRYLVGGALWRGKNPAIGMGRKDTIMSGAAILQAVLRVWPTKVLTVADRGLREGLLYSMMVAKGYFK